MTARKKNCKAIVGRSVPNEKTRHDIALAKSRDLILFSLSDSEYMTMSAHRKKALPAACEANPTTVSTDADPPDPTGKNSNAGPIAKSRPSKTMSGVLKKIVRFRRTHGTNKTNAAT